MDASARQSRRALGSTGRRNQGFTVLETLATLAIVAVVVGGTVLVWPRIHAALQLEAAVQQVASDLQSARVLAIASAGTVRLVFARGSSGYRRDRADDHGAYHLDVARSLPRGVAVADVNSGWDLTFSARGNAENGTVVLMDTRGVRRSLRINQRGRVTILPAGA